MKKTIICVFVLMLGISGCANPGSEETGKPQEISQEGLKESQTGEDDALEGTSGEIETIDVHEEIMDNFMIEAKVEIPKRRYQSYHTSLKKFEQTQLAAILMPDAPKDQLQIETYDGGGTSITYQDENIILNPGDMRYIKDDEIQYLNELYAYAEDYGKLECKELEFMSSVQAVDKVNAVLNDLGLGTALGNPWISAFTEDDLLNLQEYVSEHDENFRQMCDLGKITPKNEFEEEELVYRLSYTFTQDGLPVLGETDPQMHISGGIDASVPAYPMKALVYISASGIRYIELSGVTDEALESSGEKDIILLDGVKEALIKKYGDVILTGENKVIDIWLEYIPVINASSNGSIELIPAWCCEFYVDNSGLEEGIPEARYADRFNAFTGEEIS